MKKKTDPRILRLQTEVMAERGESKRLERKLEVANDKIATLVEALAEANEDFRAVVMDRR